MTNLRSKEDIEIATKCQYANDATIEVIKGILDFSHPGFWELNEKIRLAVFSEVAKSGMPGLIYTFVWEGMISQYAAKALSAFRSYRRLRSHERTGKAQLHPRTPFHCK